MALVSALDLQSCIDYYHVIKNNSYPIVLITEHYNKCSIKQKEKTPKVPEKKTQAAVTSFFKPKEPELPKPPTDDSENEEDDNPEFMFNLDGLDGVDALPDDDDDMAADL